jgi:putative Holliday junction resolvase
MSQGWFINTKIIIKYQYNMKYLGVDYGSKKVGFAQSDDEGRMAFPLMIAPNDETLLKDTLELVREMKFSTVVIGESVDGSGKPNPIAKEARKFAASIENAIDVKIAFEKEWYSTVEARKQPGNEGNHNVDDQAAAIVLQRYLDKVNGPSKYEEVYEEGGDEEEGAPDSW